MRSEKTRSGRVAYFYDSCNTIYIDAIWFFILDEIGNYHYGPGHPMKPHRIRMTNALLVNYGLYNKLDIYVSWAAIWK